MVTVAELQALRQARLDLLTGKRVVSVQKDGRRIEYTAASLDELNRAIDRLCRENNIDIAFNQLEVHLRNEKGDEVTEVKRDKGDDATPAMS